MCLSEHLYRALLVACPPEKALGDALQRFSTIPLLVWGRVVPDIPAFCRELVAALAEQ